MKVILNQDVSNLGEMGDVKTVAAGYARNFLLPRGFALPFNNKTVQLFEQRKAEIEAHKAEKRANSSGLREKIEAEEISLTMPAGANGKLFGAVNSQTILDELAKRNIVVDRKRIDVPDKAIKSAGNYKILIHLYEKDIATLKLQIIGEEAKRSESHEVKRPRRRHEEENAKTQSGADEVSPGEKPVEAEPAQE